MLRHVLFPALLAVALASSAAAAESGVAIEALLPHPAPGVPLRLQLGGLPAEDCVAQVAAVESLDTVMTIRLAQGHGCGGSAPAGSLLVQAPGHAWSRRGVHRIRVEDDRGPGGAPRLLGFSLLQVGPAPPTVTPEAGYWWNETGGEFDSAGPGIGLNLERQGDTLSVTVLGYAADGRPEWLFGAGPIAGQIARVSLSRLQHGGGPFDAWQAPGAAEAAGVVHFEFLSEARAVAWFQRPGKGAAITLRPLSLVRFRFDDRHATSAMGEWLIVGGVEIGDPRTHSTTLRFDAIEPTAEGFRLTGDAGAPALECEVDPDRPNSPPRRCVLRDAGGQLLVDFTDVALQRMRGWRPDGQRITALHRAGD